MNLSLQNEWKLNALSFAGSTAQIAVALSLAGAVAHATEQSSSRITIPMVSKLTATPNAILLADRDSIFFKSSAQVATSVTQSVLQKSCGLKPKSFNEQKSETCSVRFQAGELAIIKIKAQRAGVSTNTYIRAASLDSDYKQPLTPELKKTLLVVVRELTAQGNNLNQIAKHLNGGMATPNQAMSMLDSIRVPLVRALLAARNAIVQGAPQP
jgi:hypothetical protein